MTINEYKLMEKIMLDDKLNKELYKFDLKNTISPMQKEINEFLKKQDKELEKIYADRCLYKELTKWLEILNKSGLEWKKIEINNHVIKIYNFKGEK